MPSRPRQPRRLATHSHCLHASLDLLEPRMHMSATATAMAVCTCPACMASARAASLKAAVSATMKPLHALSSLSKSARTAALRAGADLFSSTTDLATAANGATHSVNLRSATPFTLNLESLRTMLKKAPLEFTKGAQDIPVTLAIPRPDGTLSRFKIVRSQIMDPALANQFATIKTYRGVGIDDPTAAVTLDTTDLGFHAQVLSPKGAYYVEPYFMNDAKGSYVSYYKADAVVTDAWRCSVASPKGGAVQDAATMLEAAQADGEFATPSITYAGTLKTYRLAVGTSYQYSAAVGGSNVANTQAAIVTAITRVTGIYETELGIRLQLVANNSSLIYTSASGSFSNGSSVINGSTRKISGIIGSANYDIGHVFTTGSGGVAFLGVVGDNSAKGGGTTGLKSPVGDPFYVDYVAHEMGHQFGAEHTFNTSTDVNINADTAYEPGSGSTIMAYAGIEGDENLQMHSDPYFHSSSIDEIRSYIASVSAGTSSPTGNTAPTVSAGATYVIPANTPFALTATGSDPDGDAVTYDWQERDLGPAIQLDDADNGSSPLFRVYAATSSPTRVFPRLASILAGSTTTTALTEGRFAERLPALARTMKFRVIARDNKAGGGGVTTADTSVGVVNTGSAFSITSFNAAATLVGGSTQTLSWNVAGTAANGINAASVNILLSTDGGLSFPTTLVANTANDGTQTFQVPYNTGVSGLARIKIQPTNNIFFDINNAALWITNVAVPGSATPGAPLLLNDSGTSTTDRITKFNNANAASVLNFSVTGTTAGAAVELLADNVVIGTATATGTTTSISTNPLPAGTRTLADGAHNFTVRQAASGQPVSSVSAATAVTIDTLAPTLAPAPATGRFEFDSAQSFRYVFSDVAALTVNADNITISRNENEPLPASAVTYNASNGVAVYSFDSILGSGNYVAQLVADSITDVAGNAVAAETSTFFILAADANHDRVVNFDDLVVLSQNYNTSGKTFSQGNFDYDVAGNVNFDDLAILAQKYNTTLAPPSVVAALISSRKATAPIAKNKGSRVAGDVLI